VRRQLAWVAVILSVALGAVAPLAGTATAGESHLWSDVFGGQVAWAYTPDIGSESCLAISDDVDDSFAWCDPRPNPSPAAPTAPDDAGLAPWPISTAGTSPAGAPTTFHLCPPADPEIQQAIAQLVAGHGYTASLAASPDGCANLTVFVAPTPATSNGSQSTSMSVSTGSQSGSARQVIAVKITSDNGETRVSVGSGS
jgi:hypothetical protein